ncbi:hypothetical protein KAZ93_01940 [Patescibacteria group bacterium]|nr:hypothetical protein [Patescibacteria group bacterium]
MSTTTATAEAPKVLNTQQLKQKELKKDMFKAAADHARTQGWLQQNDWGMEWNEDLGTYVLNPKLTVSQKETALKAAQKSLRAQL